MEYTNLAKWDRAVFATGQTTVTIGDAIRATHFRGELEPSWNGVSAPAEHEKSAIEPDLAEGQALSEQYRIDHDLISAEETELWLDARGLTLKDFNDFLIRDSNVDAF